MKLSFHGADRDVTGSCHLVECAGSADIDCGMYQGEREQNEENVEPFGLDPESIYHDFRFAGTGASGDDSKEHAVYRFDEGSLIGVLIDENGSSIFRVRLLQGRYC